MANVLIVVAYLTFIGAAQSSEELFIEPSINGPVYLQERIILSCGTLSQDIRNLTWVRVNLTSQYQTVEPSAKSFARSAPLTTTILVVAEERISYTCIGLRTDGTSANKTFHPLVNGSAQVITTVGVSNYHHLSRSVTFNNPHPPLAVNCYVHKNISKVVAVSALDDLQCQLNFSLPSFGPEYLSYSCGKLNKSLVGNESLQCDLMAIVNGKRQTIHGQPVSLLTQELKFEFTLEEAHNSSSSPDQERCYSSKPGKDSRARISKQHCTAINILSSEAQLVNRRNTSFCIDKVFSGDTIQLNCTGVYLYPTISFGVHGGLVDSQHNFHVASVVAGQTGPVTSSTAATVTYGVVNPGHSSSQLIHLGMVIAAALGLIATGFILGFFIYAYKVPQSPAGQWLIKYRPSSRNDREDEIRMVHTGV